MFLSELLLNPNVEKRRRKRSRHNSRNSEEEEDNLLIFGYSCHIFKDDHNAERLEQENGDLLIPWHDDEDYSLYLDRYDVRNLIDDKYLLDEMDNTKNENIEYNSDEELCENERYKDLDSEEELLNTMSEDEREIYLEVKREKKLKQREEEINRIKEEKEKEENEKNVNSNIPSDILKPSTIKQEKIIEKTAKFVTESSNPQIEIVIQAKQSSNPLFSFLNKNDPLYKYYTHICLLMRMGIYSYSKNNTNNDGDTIEEEAKTKDKGSTDNNSNKESIFNEKSKENNTEKINNEKVTTKKIKNDSDISDDEIQNVSNNIPENIKLIIKKMANYIARNGTEFESLVQQKNAGDPRFSFMQPWNEYNPYYKYKINKIVLKLQQEKNINNTDTQLIFNKENNKKEAKELSSKSDEQENTENSQIINNEKDQNSKRVTTTATTTTATTKATTFNNENIKSSIEHTNTIDKDAEIKALRLKKMKEILAKKKLNKKKE